MLDMNKIAKDFQNKHKKGTVSNITDYSFQYTEKKKDKEDSVIYMESYFHDELEH